MTTNTRRLLSATIAASAAMLAAASAADAANIHYDRGSNSYFIVDQSGSGFGIENNNLVVRQLGNKVQLTDSVAPITSSTGRCVIVANTAQCPTDGTYQFFLTGGNDKLDYRAPQGGQVSFGAGSDTLVGGARQTQPQSANFIATGGDGFDGVTWQDATSGVKISDSDNQPDGVFGENYNVVGFEGYTGSAFNDRIFTTPGPDSVTAGQGDDIVAGGVGDDVFFSFERDGADDYHGGPGNDFMYYAGRTQGITLAANEIADDGEPFERDFVRTNVESAVATEHDDRIFGSGAFNTLHALAGNDRVEGAGGNDTITGGAGIDTLIGDTGSDSIDARDNERDIVSCGGDSDVAHRDAVESKVSGCEFDQVGTLKLSSSKLKAQAGKATEVGLSWTHPKAWKQLKSVEVRVTDHGATLGTVTVTPGTATVEADGAVRLTKKAKTKVIRDGRTVKIAPQLKFSDQLVGRELSVEVTATDRGGNHQTIAGAATLEVR